MEKIQKKKLNVGSCHNELVRQNDFILVGGGQYGLKEMGYISGTLGDVIEHFLSKKSLDEKELIKNVQTQRFVKNQSILLTLKKDKRFNQEGKKYILVV